MAKSVLIFVIGGLFGTAAGFALGIFVSGASSSAC